MTTRSASIPALVLILSTGLASSAALAQHATADTSSRIEIPKVSDDAKGRPPIFADLSLTDALAKAKREDKLLIIKFTAEWCGPCKQMDKTTWRNQSIFDWAKDNAVIIAVDVDKDTKTSEQHKIKAMPTMVAYRDGVEFDRTVGYMDSSKTLSWMKDVKDGKSKAAAARERAAKSDGKSAQQRMEDVRTLIEAGDYAAAQPILIDLWQHMAEDEPAMTGVRRSFFARDIQTACAEHKPTRDAFITIRDEDEAKLKTNPDYETLTDWIVLNNAVGQPEKTLEWFDRVKSTDMGKATAQRLFYLIEPLIKERGDLRDISIVTRKPVAQIRSKLLQARRTEQLYANNADDASLVAYMWNSARTDVGLLHAALLLDERTDEAAACRAEAIKLDDTPALRLALIESANEHIPASYLARASARVWALPLLDEVDAALKNTPNADNHADLAARAAAARKALSQ